ncbi:hypothetical protein Ahy_A01g000344 [Arachis hypogaea]|uniref:Uncharacterized protein n=1 Tax=Arachis hypogaea TaxID=3818 RepID=A0A445EJW7_ARAHY|nr:hypothetical protein Ahy_A01g000344 [Arachis hypogaea]
MHGHPTNHESCVYACAAIDRVNKYLESFCHRLLTTESYKVTYSHHINPLPGQQLWKQSEYNRPLAPLVRPLKKKAPNRLAKMALRRRSPPPTRSTILNQLQEASEAIAEWLAGFLKFVPIPGFKAPRKK